MTSMRFALLAATAMVLVSLAGCADGESLATPADLRISRGGREVVPQFDVDATVLGSWWVEDQGTFEYDGVDATFSREASEVEFLGGQLVPGPWGAPVESMVFRHWHLRAGQSETVTERPGLYAFDPVTGQFLARRDLVYGDWTLSWEAAAEGPLATGTAAATFVGMLIPLARDGAEVGPYRLGLQPIGHDALLGCNALRIVWQSQADDAPDVRVCEDATEPRPLRVAYRDADLELVRSFGNWSGVQPTVAGGASAAAPAAAVAPWAMVPDGAGRVLVPPRDGTQQVDRLHELTTALLRSRDAPVYLTQRSTDIYLSRLPIGYGARVDGELSSYNSHVTITDGPSSLALWVTSRRVVGSPPLDLAIGTGGIYSDLRDNSWPSPSSLPDSVVTLAEVLLLHGDHAPEPTLNAVWWVRSGTAARPDAALMQWSVVEDCDADNIGARYATYSAVNGQLLRTGSAASSGTSCVFGLA